MFGLGTGELIVILVIVFLEFGASRLPELGKGLGQGMRQFKDALKGDEKPESKPTDIDPNKGA
jgi:sec-independent protein translocase protein TatA